MANSIKYNEISTEPLSLKKGDFYIGTGDVQKGPSNFFSTITPPNGGYAIYLDKPTDGPSIYVAENDSQLVSHTNKIAGTSFTTANECLTYFDGQTDKICFNRNYDEIITDGLVLNLDAGFTPSYPRSGTTCSDLSIGSKNGILTNGPTFDSENGGSIVFDGSDDFISVPINAVFNTPSVTFEVWANLQSRNNRHIVYVNWSGNSLEINSNRSVSFYNLSSAGQQGSTTAAAVFEFNTWTHFVGTYDNESQTLKTYVNGVLLATRLNTPSTNYSVRTHAVSGNPFGGQILGKISIVRHYNRALSHSEVIRNYDAQKARFGLM